MYFNLGGLSHGGHNIRTTQSDRNISTQDFTRYRRSGIVCFLRYMMFPFCQIINKNDFCKFDLSRGITKDPIVYQIAPFFCNGELNTIAICVAGESKKQGMILPKRYEQIVVFLETKYHQNVSCGNFRIGLYDEHWDIHLYIWYGCRNWAH